MQIVVWPGAPKVWFCQNINSILERMWTGAEEVKLNTALGRLVTSVQPIKGGKGRCEKAGWLAKAECRPALLRTQEAPGQAHLVFMLQLHSAEPIYVYKVS